MDIRENEEIENRPQIFDQTSYIDLSKEQSLSIQKKIARAIPDSKTLKKLLESYCNGREVDLTKHIYGNFVIQKFLDCKIPTIVNSLIEKLIPDLINLSKDRYGCRIVQLVSDSSLKKIFLFFVDFVDEF